MFRKSFFVRWGEVDSNGHMKNTAYLDVCADVRMLFFADHGLPMGELRRVGIGPVILSDEIEYHRELHLLDEFDVTLGAAGGSEDCSHFLLLNEVWRRDGRRAARLLSRGGWVDLARRRFAAPPQQLVDAMRQMPKADEFRVLETLVKSG